MSTYQITEVGDGLFKISSRLGPRYFHQYVLKEEDDVLLFDVGMIDTPETVIIPACREIGIEPEDIKYILISHADVDHFSGLQNMKKHASNAAVIAHTEDVAWIESTEKIQKERYFYYESLGVKHDDEMKDWFINSLQAGKVDFHINGGETICLGSGRLVDIIHTPGHSKGHISLYDRKNKAAIVIDAILWKGLYDTEGVIISPPPYYLIDEYIESIETILKLDVDLLLTGHFDPLTGMKAQSFLHESITYVKEVEAVILSLISKTPKSLNEILHETNEQVGQFIAMMVELVGPVYVHLQKLEKAGKITRVYIDNRPYWIC